MWVRIVICDDDILVTNQLVALLREFFATHHLIFPSCGVYHSGDELLKQEPGGSDIAFLDVEMPGKSGIYTGAELQKRNPNVKIFIITSYSDYLDEAMRFHVFRYLTKPINKNRLFCNLKDALKCHDEDERLVILECDGNTVVIRENDIIYIETSGRNVLIHTNSQVFTTSKPIEYWQQRLNPYTFFLTYRSYIVNLRYISSFNQTTVYLKSLSEEIFSVYLSRRKYTEFKNAFFQYSLGRA